MSDEGQYQPEAARNLGDGAWAGRLWLFLDYDGTLAGFAPNPDVIQPDPELIELIKRLSAFPDRLRITILSGRRLAHVADLLPVPGLLLAGSYGVEFRTWEGKQVNLVSYETGRCLLERVKARWQALIDHLEGFYLEDKGFTVALHGRSAGEDVAQRVIEQAQRLADEVIPKDGFTILGGDRFVEVAPSAADKGQSIVALIERFPWPGAQLVYIGDDDKDEPAFNVVRRLGGRAILVAEKPRPGAASERLANPQAVRAWLRQLAESLENNTLDYLRMRTD